MEEKEMENVIVNGKIETIGSNRDIVDIIRECCGDDFATLIDNRLNIPLEQNITPELIETCLRRTDFYSYEASLDSWNCVGNDVLDECEKQIEYIEESKRIDKTKLYDSFVEIAKMIRSEL